MELVRMAVSLSNKRKINFLEFSSRNLQGNALVRQYLMGIIKKTIFAIATTV